MRQQTQGNRISIARMLAGLSIEKLARNIFISPDTLRAIERSGGECDPLVLHRISMETNRPVEWFSTNYRRPTVNR